MPEIMYDPHFWTGVAFFALIVLSYKKVAPMVTDALDGRIGDIRSELNEARRLREEAEDVLAQYTHKQGEYLKEAESILSDARRDAETLTQHAQKELAAALDLRMKNALERISQEEAKAITDVRNHVVDMSLAAARALIADQVNHMSEEELVHLALADIERKIH